MVHSEKQFKNFEKAIENFENTVMRLEGLSEPRSRTVLIQQLCDSKNRVDHISHLVNRSSKFSNFSSDPASLSFNPLKAAITQYSKGNVDEAFWLVFLFTHFGVNKKSKNNLVRNFYGRLGTGQVNTWTYVKNNLAETLNWLDSNIDNLKNVGSFGNHRKYQSLKAYSNAGTGMTITSYIELTSNEYNGIEALLESLPPKIKSDRGLFFDSLYDIFNSRIKGFSRLSTFDFLTMIGKVGFADIEPNNPYIVSNATGPKIGAAKLFAANNASVMDLNNLLRQLGNALPDDCNFKMQIIEDAVCNWQKSPSEYEYFNG